MIRFNNDYNQAAHPAVLQLLADSSAMSHGGYGIDEWCERASAEIKKELACPTAVIHFLVGGTQANFTVISAALRPYQSVISADSGHINVHETGAVEACGHKVIALPGKNGKITADQVEAVAAEYEECGGKEHITQPKMVYISFATEYGTIYTKQDLTAISGVCRKYGLYLFIDGARLGYGLGAADNDVTLADIAALADVFYIGGTKCGAMFGEAVVIVNDDLKPGFRSCIKQHGGMLAKGWLLGVQFYALFKDGLYFSITKQADEYAMQLKQAFQAKGIKSYIESSTNQQFVILNKTQEAALSKKYIFEFQHKIDAEHNCVRFCTSWSTTAVEIAELVKDIEAL